MEWYIPITILPGIGMLIMSTTSQMMALSTEIGNYLASRCSPFEHKISDMKIKQLRRLTWSASLLYSSAACFVLSGIIGALLNESITMGWTAAVSLFGVVLVLAALTILINYGFHTIRIRTLQHQHNHKQEE